MSEKPLPLFLRMLCARCVHSDKHSQRGHQCSCSAIARAYEMGRRTPPAKSDDEVRAETWEEAAEMVATNLEKGEHDYDGLGWPLKLKALALRSKPSQASVLESMPHSEVSARIVGKFPPQASVEKPLAWAECLPGCSFAGPHDGICMVNPNPRPASKEVK